MTDIATFTLPEIIQWIRNRAPYVSGMPAIADRLEVLTAAPVAEPERIQAAQDNGYTWQSAGDPTPRPSHYVKLQTPVKIKQFGMCIPDSYFAYATRDTPVSRRKD